MSQHPSKNDIKLGNTHIRPRRLRENQNIRSLVQEHTLSKSDFIYPIFVSEPGTVRFPLVNLPEVSRIPYEELIQEIEEVRELGIHAVMLFPVIDKSKKDLLGVEAYNPSGLMQMSVKAIKETFSDMIVFVDVALDPYTSHGHDGIIDLNGYVLNDETVEALCKQSLSYAISGADFVCPSDMMDGRIGAIRHHLDEKGFTRTGILSYSAKYASAFYGPFREAVASGARGLDKKTYQLNPANSREAIREAKLDIEEGADMVMIKPGMLYLDILSQIKQESPVPLVVYQVSGEYAMLKFAAQNNLIDEKSAVFESLIAFKRAGADLIVSYYAKWVCKNIL